MADRSVKVLLRAEVSGFKAAMAQAAESARAAQQEIERVGPAGETSLGRMVQSATRNREAWETTGRTLTAFGVGTVAALGATAKAAIDWESAWVGVKKTVEGTPAQLAKVEDGLRSMARELPASHQEIAAVAQAAGQLGVATDDVVDFTRTMITLGETTNMSAEEAATSLSRFMNIMGTAPDKVSNLGSTLVGLGNNFATTESEILAMSMRLAGAGKQVGLTEAQVMGLATAMSSVGIEAEAGGTAMSMVMKKINTAVKSGSDEVQGFAKVAGMSAQDFAKAFQENPAKALTAFVEGLQRAGSQGQDLSTVLGDLGIKGIRETDTLLRLAGAGDLLSNAFSRATDEFSKNTAMMSEAEQRFATVDSQIKIAGNNIKDAAIGFGSVFMPAVASASKVVADFATGMAGLPQPVQGVIAGLTGIAGVGALVGGSFLLIFPRVIETVNAMKQLGDIAPGVGSKLGTVGKYATGLAIGWAGLTVIGNTIGAFQKAGMSSEELGQKLLEVSKGGDKAKTSLNELFTVSSVEGLGSIRKLGDEFQGMLDTISDTSKLSKFGGGLADFAANAAKVVGFDARSDWQQFRDLLQQTGERLAQMDAKSAAATFQEFANKTDGSRESLKRLLDQMPAYKDALLKQANAANVNLKEQELLDLALGKIPPSMQEVKSATEAASGALDDQAESIDTVLTKMIEMATGVLNQNAAQRSFQEAIEAANQSVQQYGQNLDITTAAGRSNSAALDGIASSGLKAAEAMKQNGATQQELNAQLQATREATIQAGMAMGMSADEANAYADKLQLIPDAVTTEVENNALEVAGKVEQLTGKLEGLPGQKSVIIDEPQSPQVLGRLRELGYKVETLPDGKVLIAEQGADTVLLQVENIVQKLAAMPGEKTLTISEPMSPDVITRLQQLGLTVTTLPDGNVQVTETGSDTVEAALAQVSRQRDASVIAQADTGTAESLLEQASRLRNAPYGTSADTSVASSALDGVSSYVRNAPYNTSADTSTAQSRLDGVSNYVRNAPYNTSADTSNAQSRLDAVSGRTRVAPYGTSADTSNAEGALANTARSRNSPVNAVFGQDFATGTLNQIAATRNAVINAVTNGTSGHGVMGHSGGLLSPMHDGGFLEFMAQGGLRGQKLTPMSPIAQVVPPDTWRVVGDRMDVPEAYIPLNNSQRSLDILKQAVDRFPGVELMRSGGEVSVRPDMEPSPAYRAPNIQVNTGGQGSGPVRLVADLYDRDGGFITTMQGVAREETSRGLAQSRRTDQLGRR